MRQRRFRRVVPFRVKVAVTSTRVLSSADATPRLETADTLRSIADSSEDTVTVCVQGLPLLWHGRCLGRRRLVGGAKQVVTACGGGGVHATRDPREEVREGLLAGGGGWQMQRHDHVTMAAAEGPGQTVPRPTLEGDWEVRQAPGAVHHLPIPSAGEPLPERSHQATEPLVLVVPAARAQAP
eukprot:1262677-Rhodomonas_salina.2